MFIFLCDKMLTMYLHRADSVDYGTALNLTGYLTNETEYIVWQRVTSSVAYVRDMLASDSEIYPKFQVSTSSAENIVNICRGGK